MFGWMKRTLLLLAILPVLTVALYAFPQADDWCFASATLRDGHFGSVLGWYNSWSGRYFSHFINSFNPLWFKSGSGFVMLYPLWSFLNIGFVIFSSHLFIKSYGRAKHSFESAWIGFLLFVALTPELVSSLYWSSTLNTYLLGLSFFVLFLRELLFIRRISVLLVTSFLAIGSNELIMALVLGSSVIWVMKEKGLKAIGVLSWILLLCSAVYFSPGTELRGASFPLRKQLWFSVSHMPGHLYELLSDLMLNNGFVLFIIALLLLRSRKTTAGFSKLTFVMVPILTFAIAIVMTLWAQGQFPDKRTLILPTFVFVGSLVLIFLPSVSSLGFFRFALAAAFIFQGYQSNVNLQSIRDFISFRSPVVSYENQKLISEVVDCAKSPTQDCSISRRTETPSLLFYSTLTDDPGHWRNVCFAEALGLSKVRVPTDLVVDASPIFAKSKAEKELLEKTISDLLNHSEVKLELVWGLGRYSFKTIEKQQVLSIKDENVLERELPEGLISFFYEDKPFLGFYRRNQWTKKLSLVDVIEIPNSTWRRWDRQQDTDYTELEMPLIVWTESAKKVVARFDAGEQKIFISK